AAPATQSPRPGAAIGYRRRTGRAGRHGPPPGRRRKDRPARVPPPCGCRLTPATLRLLPKELTMAGIIKAGQRTPLATPSKSSAYQLDDMEDAYLSRVRGEAARIIADARTEAARLMAQAAEDGKQTAMKGG